MLIEDGSGRPRLTNVLDVDHFDFGALINHLELLFGRLAELQ